MTRFPRTIALLRKRVPGTWTYDPQTYTWRRQEGGWAHWQSLGYDEYTESSTGAALRYYPNSGDSFEVVRKYRGIFLEAC